MKNFWRSLWGWLATKEELRAVEKRLVMNDKELAAGIKAQTDIIAIATAQVAKVGAETDDLKQRVADLEAAIENHQEEVAPEVADAFEALKAQTTAVSIAINAVDLKVPDAPAPTPAP